MSSNLPGIVPSPPSLSDKLTIDTPEQTSLEFVIAGIGSRFLALAIDTLIQMGIALVAFFGGVLLAGVVATVTPKAGIWAFAIILLLFFIIYFGYFAIFEIFWNGQTPGKRKIGIRVIKDSGRPLTPAESIARNLMRIVDLLPAFYAIGAFCALFSKESKRLGDYVAGSLVVREGSFAQLKSVWEARQGPNQPPGPSFGSANLSSDDFVLIESYLNRRLDLDPDVRFRMAQEILQRIGPRLTLPPNSTLSSEQVLEALSLERCANSRFG